MLLLVDQVIQYGISSVIAQCLQNMFIIWLQKNIESLLCSKFACFPTIFYIYVQHFNVVLLSNVVHTKPKSCDSLFLVHITSEPVVVRLTELIESQYFRFKIFFFNVRLRIYILYIDEIIKCIMFVLRRHQLEDNATHCIVVKKSGCAWSQSRSPSQLAFMMMTSVTLSSVVDEQYDQRRNAEPSPRYPFFAV